ncbi:MAG TPA: rod shape-determining protein MreC [Mycobacteriales bacterium]|nr:rod shape-determining protein MreC [Mycobacteriales bacterium]
MTPPTGPQRRAMLVLLVISLAFITLDYRSASFNGVRSAAQAVFGPVQRGVTAVAAPVGRFFAGIPDAAGSHGRITELQRQNADLRRRLTEQTLTASRVDELQKLELLAGQGQYRVLPATVVSLGPSLGFEWTVTIDAGSRDGVKVDMTVVNGDGLVGRIKQVDAYTSVVVLAIDPGSSVGVRLAGSNQLGVASGAGLSPVTFESLDPQTRARPGDRLLTGPYGGTTYVAGVPVGEVTAVTGDPGSTAHQVTVRPYVTFTALDLVGVVLAGPRQDPRDAVLPPRPGTTPQTSATGTPPNRPAGPPSTSGTR